MAFFQDAPGNPDLFLSDPGLRRASPAATRRSAWTSGQWMTERTGGSDVGLTETVARGPRRHLATPPRDQVVHQRDHLADGAHARAPRGQSPRRPRPRALLRRDPRRRGTRLQRIAVNRLKDKLGTRKVPTAELTLDGTPATRRSALSDGIRAITPMLNITRTWNAVCAGRRGHAPRRRPRPRLRPPPRAFGAALSDKPLHARHPRGLQAEFEAALPLTFRAVELLGRDEAGEATEDEARLLRG
jgi:acyl-CoA dehydrogenase